MRLYNYLLILLVLAAGNATAQTSQLYYLCLGNADYAAADAYTRVPACSRSAQRMDELLGKYGTGEILLSAEGSYLTKERVLARVEALLNRAINDKSAIVVIYYSGHGLSDNLDNLYWVPGDIDAGMKLTQYTVMDKFIGVREIQSIFNDYVNEHYQTANLSWAATYQSMMNSMGNMAQAKQDRSMDSMTKTAGFKKLVNELPKLVILADCCYEHFFKNPRILAQSEGSIVKLYTDHKELIGTRNDKKNSYYKDDDDDEEDEEGMEDMPVPMADITGHAMWKSERKYYNAMGNKVLYSATISELTETIEDPNGGKALSPICRRSTLYFQSPRQQFSVLDLVTKLTAKEFDTKTPPAKSEVADNENSMTVKQAEGAGWLPPMYNNRIYEKKN